MFFFFMDPSEMPVFGRGLAKLELALDRIRATDGGMPVGTVATLVHTARRLVPLAAGSLSLGDIAGEMDVPYATFLRHTDALAEGGSRTRRLNLIEKGVRPDDRRARQIRLTSDGLGLLRDLDEILAPRSK